jgi:malonyl-CoA/methylmalonyl-CoA synthetase
MENELISRARSHGARVAISAGGRSFTYEELLARSSATGGAVASALGRRAPGERVAYLVPAGFEHVATQWGIWRAGAIGVPLSASQAPAEWAYIVSDTRAAAIVADPGLEDTVRSALAENDVRFIAAGASGSAEPDPHIRLPDDSAALILYTSGTTGKPKGVVLTHANLEAQIRCLVEAWGWQGRDRILHVLPLNHVHGMVNALMCALWAGATCEMLPGFDALETWRAFRTGRLTLFMAVPTIYRKLIAEYEAAPEGEQQAMSLGCRSMRLMVSGSAALPVRILERWLEISGHVLLERYGMTEIGMALSNPLDGERRPGFVGVPLPNVEVRIVDGEGRRVASGTSGELEVRGSAVFRDYWQRPHATAAAFRGGWFRTGDIAVLERGMYRLLGRQSVDIIKSGGYKISALEIEEVLREHPLVLECAVVGVEDPEWGEQVAAAVVLREAAGQFLEANGRHPSAGDVIAAESKAFDVGTLREWARPRLARYKLPKRLAVVADLPRNAMGKVSKPMVRQLFEG